MGFRGGAENRATSAQKEGLGQAGRVWSFDGSENRGEGAQSTQLRLPAQARWERPEGNEISRSEGSGRWTPSPRFTPYH